MQLALVRQVDTLGVAAELGATSTVAWLRDRYRISGSAATRLVKLAQAMDPEAGSPVAAALAAGAVNVEQATVITDAVEKLPAEHRQAGEEHLVGEAEVFGPRELGRLGQRIFEVVAPDEADKQALAELERAERRAWHKRGLWFIDIPGTSQVRVHGYLTQEDAATVRAVTDPFCAPHTRHRHTSHDTGDTSGSDTAAATSAAATSAATPTPPTCAHQESDARTRSSRCAGSPAPAANSPTTAATDPKSSSPSTTTTSANRSAPPPSTTARCCHRPPPGGWPATPASSPPSSAPPANPSTSADKPASSPAPSEEHSSCGTRAAPSPAAIDHTDGATPTTSSTGATAAQPNRPTWCFYVATTTRLIHHADWQVRINPKDGLPEFTPPAYVDADRRPRRNNYHRRE